jgi:hypothetical protein
MWEVMTAVITVYKDKEVVQENVMVPKSAIISSYLLYVTVQEYSETPLTIKNFRQIPVKMQQTNSGTPYTWPT